MGTKVMVVMTLLKLKAQLIIGMEAIWAGQKIQTLKKLLNVSFERVGDDSRPSTRRSAAIVNHKDTKKGGDTYAK